MNHAPRKSTDRDGRHDFDFLFGAWTVVHRRRKEPLRGSDEWYTFDGTAVEHPIWDGAANVEEMLLESPLGAFRGMAVRLYDAASGLWSIYWGTDKGGLSIVPTVGGFNDNGTGEFSAREEFEGKPIICRFQWLPISASRARWEQAFSADDGATWELNWTMDFQRRQEAE